METPEAAIFRHCDVKELRPGYRGIPEPPAAARLVPSEALDLVLVPGVAFDRRGGRLGQGGGVYDRLLAAPTFRAHTVGVAFAAQIIASVPAREHDRRMDTVITELGTASAGLWSHGAATGSKR